MSHRCEAGECEIADPGECPECLHHVELHGDDGCRYRVTVEHQSMRSGATWVEHDDCPCRLTAAGLAADVPPLYSWPMVPDMPPVLTIGLPEGEVWSDETIASMIGQIVAYRVGDAVDRFTVADAQRGIDDSLVVLTVTPIE